MLLVSQGDFDALSRRARDGGAIGVPGHLRWSVSGWCDSPVYIEVRTSRTVLSGVLDLEVPCRMCSGCMRLRAHSWSKRALTEYSRSERSWLWTGTYGPVVRWSLAESVRSAPVQEARRALVRAGGKYVGRWLKRLRKAGVSVRYMCVPELHKDGALHWHAILHTPKSARYRDVAGRWSVGFEKLKLIPADRANRATRYVAKYLAKERLGRIRASKSYGLVPVPPSEGNPPIWTGVEELPLMGENVSVSEHVRAARHKLLEYLAFTPMDEPLRIEWTGLDFRLEQEE